MDNRPLKESNKEFNSEKRSRKNIDTMLATQISRSAFDEYRKKTTGRFKIIFAVGLMLSILGNVVQGSKSVPFRYIYADANGRISTLTAMNRPNMTDSDIAVWSTEALSNALSFDYVRYREEMQGSQKYFTPQGWQKFQEMLQASHLFDQVNDQKLIAASVPVKAPTIVSSGSEGGVYVWHLIVPMQITLHTNSATSQSGSSQINVNVHLTVQRLPETIQTSAIGISGMYIDTN